MSETRDNIVVLADKLIRTQGFNAFSYKDISIPLAIRNAAIHYHFPAKTLLGISVIDRELEGMAACREKWRKLPGDQQLVKIIERFDVNHQEGQLCLMGSLSSDYDTLPVPMQEKVQEMCSAILDWVTACLEAGRKAGKLHFAGDASDRALLVMSELLASLLLSRVLGNAVFGKIKQRLLKDLENPGSDLINMLQLCEK